MEPPLPPTTTMTAFETAITIRFRHCDPAGIVFYPRYFEILNDLIEDWFASLNPGFHTAIGDLGVALPLVAVAATFTAPSRLGDILRAEIAITSLGRTSCALSVGLFGHDGQRRVHFTPTMVCVEVTGLRPTPWPEALRAALRQFAS